jgi:ABC-type antimicrobial peptide transport system permease subunit
VPTRSEGWCGRRHIHYFDIVHLLCGDVGRYVQKSELRWMFLRSALALTGIGVLIGLGAAAAIAQVMTTLLFGVSPLDPLSFAVVPLILVLAAALASFLPASRATAVNPVDALKAE